jgi:hypothetical protein
VIARCFRRGFIRESLYSIDALVVKYFFAGRKRRAGLALGLLP